MKYKLKENHPHAQLLAEVIEYLEEKQVQLIEPGIIQIQDRQYYIVDLEDAGYGPACDSFPPSFDYKLVYEK